MTTAIHSELWAWLTGPAPQAKTGPERQHYAGPIFIHDAVVPWKSSTVLYEMLRRDLEEAEPPHDQST